MPSYQEVLDADPAEFESCGGELEDAASDLSSSRERYRVHLLDTDADWTGEDRHRLHEESTDLEHRASGLEQSLEGRAAVLKTLGPALALAVADLQRIDRELRAAGYDIDPGGPRVRPGPSPAVPGPCGPALRTLDELTADSATALLAMMYRAVVLMDETLADALESGEAPAGLVRSILDEWDEIAGVADVMRARIASDRSGLAGEAHAEAVRRMPLNRIATESVLGIAARFARPQ